jgi:hypothetical protein
VSAIWVKDSGCPVWLFLDMMMGGVGVADNRKCLKWCLRMQKGMRLEIQRGNKRS